VTPPYPLNWGVFAALSVSAAIAIFLPLFAAIVLSLRARVSPKYFVYGAAVFLVSQVILRLPWQIPLNNYLKDTLLKGGAPFVAFIAFSSLTAGVFEEVGRWIGYRSLVKDERSWRTGMMFGLGHGGIESIILIGLNLAVQAGLYLSIARGTPMIPVPQEQMELVVKQFSSLTALTGLLAGVERIFALLAHCGLSLLVLRAYVLKDKRWLWIAIAAHAVMDFAGVIVAKYAGPVAAEGVIALFAAAAVYVIVKMRSEPLPATPTAVPAAN
jgi:uncharacterized membrane protein YhfC